ncbi:MAG TPA: hypothetical protein VKB57_20125 [Acidimicrobiales bacterium]|nr:hypothetical protein [Acidimicrobiales bacterium]
MQGPRTTIRRAALPLLLAATLAVAGCGRGGTHDGGGPAAAARPTTTRPTTTTAPAPRPVAVTAPTTTTPAPAPAPAPFVCPERTIADVRTLQHAVDQGHQPWLLSPEDVAEACTFPGEATTVTPAGDHRYRVTETRTGRTALVQLAQPLGPGTIWVAAGVT